MPAPLAALTIGGVAGWERRSGVLEPVGAVSWALRLAAVCALLACCQPRGPRLLHAGPGELTLATFNLHLEAADDAETVATVGELAADLVLLQEVTPRWQEVLEQRYGTLYPHRLFAPARGAGGLGVLSRFPLRDEGLLTAPIRHPAWLVAAHTPAGELHLLNVHLRASRRRGQSLLAGLYSLSSDHELEVRHFVEHARVAPQVIAGDFNEGPHGAAVRWLLARGFTDALQQHQPGTPTFRALGGVYTSTLDHVLLAAELVAVDAWVLRRGNSDHWPLLVRLRRASERAR